MDEVDGFASYLLDTDQVRTFDEMLVAIRRADLDELVRPEIIHRHVLGFIQLRIATRRSKELRIHYWPIAVSFSEEPHTHLWNLTSYVLAGEIASTEYAVESTPDDRTGQQIFIVKPAANGTVRVATGQHARVSVSAIGSHRAGSVYMVDHGVYHISGPVSGMALTLITTSAPMSAFPLVVTNPQSSRSGHAPMTPATTQEQHEFRSILWQAIQ